jgi:hypothetical protein
VRSLILLSSVVFAATTLASTVDDALNNCRAISDNNKRLQCYDTIHRHTPAPPKASTPPQQASNSAMVEVAASAKRPEELFGFEDIEIAKQMPESIEVEVVEALQIHGKRVFRFANGQVWRQIDSKRFVYNPDNGQAYIQRGALGSFFFSQRETNARIRVKRVE